MLFSPTHPFYPPLSRTLTQSITLLLVGALAWLLSTGPQPLSDRMLVQLGPGSPGTSSLLIQTPANTTPQTIHGTIQLLRAQGASAVLPLGTHSAYGPPTAEWLEAPPDWEFLGLNRSWSGQIRGLSTAPGTLTGRLLRSEGHSTTGAWIGLPLGAGPQAGIHLSQLGSLDPSTIKGRLVVLTPRSDWSTQRYSSPWGESTYGEILARAFSGAPLRQLLPPALTLVFLLLLCAATMRFPAFWLPSLLLSLLLTIGSAVQGIRLPLEALWGGLLACRFLYVRQERARRQQETSRSKDWLRTLPPAETPSDAVLWQELCNAAHLFYGALAAWAFVQEDSFWKEVGRAGDASPLDQELLGRLQSAPSAGEPGDLAFVAMPVPASGDRVGLLILQPGDRTEADPWVVLGGATERIARIVRTRENGGATEAINLLDLQEKLLSLRGHQSTQSPRVLFDPLGHWLMGSDNFYDELRLSCSPGADLLSHWEALGGTPEQLVEVGAKTVSLQSQFRGRQFSLKAGIHAGKVECYILKVDSRERKANEARNQESPC